MSRFPQIQFLLSVAAPAQFPPDIGAEVAFAGRSNAGKSSAINAITERKALARTSKTPGLTRLLNYFELQSNQRIVDLPGYGFAEVRNDERRKWARCSRVSSRTLPRSRRSGRVSSGSRLSPSERRPSPPRSDSSSSARLSSIWAGSLVASSGGFFPKAATP